MNAALYLAQDFLNRPSPLDAAAGIRRERMRQYLLLAVLLHVWLVLMFGTAPGGAARPGEGAWGRLSVLLEGPVASGSSTSATVPDTGPPGQAPQQRFGGTVRPADSPRQDLPGAEKTGTWRALESPNEPLLPDAAAITPLKSQQADLPAASTTELDQLKPMSTARMSESNSRAELQRPTSPAPTKLTPAQPADLPSMTVPSLDGLKPMSTARMADSPARTDLQRPPTPAAPSKLAPSPSTELPNMVAPSLDGLKPMSTARMAESTSRPESATQPNQAAPAKLAPTQATELSHMAVPSLDGIKPMSTATLPAGGANTRVEALPKAQDLAQQKLPANKTPEIGAAPAVEAPGPVAASPLPGLGSRAPGGSPNAGAQQGHDVATAPSAPDSKRPLNLNLPSRGPLVSHGGGSGLLPLVPKPPETKSAMEKAVKKAEKADCRKAYAGAGILAPAAAVVDAVTGKGCTF